jgi:hypothetical protein
MRRQLSPMIFVAACAFGASAAHSAPSQAKPPAPNPTVLSGCLLQSRADTTTADAKGIIYTLDVAESAAERPETPAMSSSKAAARSTAVAKTRYALSTEAAIDFARHVGHHVELTGQVLERLHTVKPSAGQPAATVATLKPLPGAADRMFQVATLKMISGKCP